MCFFQHRRHYRMLWIFQGLKIEQCSLDGVSLVLICLNCLIAVRILETWKNVLNKEKNELVERNTQERCHVTRDIVQYAFENDCVHSYVKERWLLQSYSTSSDKVSKFGVKIYHRNFHIVLNWKKKYQLSWISWIKFAVITWTCSACFLFKNPTIKKINK